MVLEIIPTTAQSVHSVVLNGFVLKTGTLNEVIQIKAALEELSRLHRICCYEEHSLNKTTGEPESDLRITIHIVKR